MKNRFYLAALFGAAVVFAGCSDDDIVDGGAPANTGDEIIFGAVGNVETRDMDSDSRSTRTSYGDYKTNGEGTVVSQVINWVDGDRVMLYSPQAYVPGATGSYVEYQVSSAGNTTGVLSKVNASAPGLQWGDADEHTFYGVYPALSQLGDTYRGLFSFNGTVLTGYIPTTQYHTISETAGGYQAKCNMNYAHMAARATALKSQSANGVSLDFYPIVTALDITLTAKSRTTLNAININARDGEPIAGQYTADLTTIGQDGNGNYPDCDLLQTSSENLSYITIPTYIASGEGDNVTYTPITLESGKSVTFTVFMLPHVDLDNITVRLSALNAQSKACNLNDANGTSIILRPHQKTIVRMEMPEFGGGNNWFSNVDDNVYFSQVSIPGTANSFSYGLSDETHKTQIANIEAQWNAGVRCFELRGPNNASGNSLADAQLQCNRQNVGTTFGRAVEQILKLLADNPNEFAVIIPAFESNEGRDNFMSDYLSDLNYFYENNLPSLMSGDMQSVTYSPDMTAGDIRGNVMFVARITSEEDGDDILEQLQSKGISTGMAISRWGSLKDNWAHRGYTVNGTRADIWCRNYATTSVEYYMMNGNITKETGAIGHVPDPSHLAGNKSFTWNTNAVGEPSKTIGDLASFVNAVDYEHTSYRSDKTTGTVFVQDWMRVVPSNAAGNYYMSYYTREWGGSGIGNNYDFTMYWTYWDESYSEKQADIWNTFLLSQNREAYGNNAFFINSLDGYYVTSNVPQSYFPYIEGTTPYSASFGDGGMAGDIENYAKDINAWFYNRLMEYGTQNLTGPLNIVLLDRVLDGTDGGNYLPQVIVNNNFMFPLDMKESSDASYSSGGAVIQ